MNLKGFCRLWAGRRWRSFFLLVFALAVTSVVVLGVRRALYGSSEFTGFRRIVQVSLVQDRNHYEHIEHLRAYPPFFAIFWTPFGLFPVGLVPGSDDPSQAITMGQRIQLGLSAAALLVVMVAMTVWSVRWVMAACHEGGEGEPRSCAPALLWALTGGLMLNGIIRCETDMFVVAMVSGSMLLMLAKDRQWGGGALLGVAAALKLTPGLFGLYLLCRRKWRALGGMVIAGFVCTVVVPAVVWGPKGSFERHRSWVTKVLIPYAREGPESFIGDPYRRLNQSPKAALVRYLTDYTARKSGKSRGVAVADLPMSAVRKIALAFKLSVLGLLILAWALPAPARRRELEALLFALVPLGMLLLSDVSHGSHLSILVVPFGALTAFCFAHAGERIGTRVSWGVLLCFLLVNLIAVQRLKEMSVGTLGLLVVFGMTAYLAFRQYAQGRGVRTPQPD